MTEPTITVRRVPTVWQLPLHVRLRYSILRWRLGPEGRRLDDQLQAELERRFLGLS